MTRRFLFVGPMLCALAFLSCSTKSKDTPKDKKPAADPAKNSQVSSSHQPAVDLGDGPHTIIRTPLQTQMRTSATGESFAWKLLDGIEVEGEAIAQLYKSKGSVYLGYKAKVTVSSDADCLVRWRAELIDGPTGRGTSLGTIRGNQPIKRGQFAVVSGLVALSTEEATKVGSASAGFWTLCGDALPKPSALDVELVETKVENVPLGNAFELHHTLFQVKSQTIEASGRCYFELVAEDVNAEGYTLNRDFATFGLRAGEERSASLRRTAFEGGAAMDFVPLSTKKRSYLRNMSCMGPWQASQAKLTGIQIDDIQVQPVETKAGLAQQAFNHSATLTNLTGKDCSFRIRYRLLDAKDTPLHKSPVLSETLHLHKGAKELSYHSTKERLHAWRSQVEDIGRLVVEEAKPLHDCQRFDVKQALSADQH